MPSVYGNERWIEERPVAMAEAIGLAGRWFGGVLRQQACKRAAGGCGPSRARRHGGA